MEVAAHHQGLVVPTALGVLGTDVAQAQATVPAANAGMAAVVLLKKPFPENVRAMLPTQRVEHRPAPQLVRRAAVGVIALGAAPVLALLGMFGIQLPKLVGN